jgi:hypothetical protein
MLLALQVFVFTGCALLGLLPSTEVDCRLDLPPIAFASPPPAPAEPASAPLVTARDR